MGMRIPVSLGSPYPFTSRRNYLSDKLLGSLQNDPRAGAGLLALAGDKKVEG